VSVRHKAPGARGLMYRFDSEKLTRAILARERTIYSFAKDAEITATTAYRAVSGEPVTMTIALRITTALKRLRVNPTLVELAADVLDKRPDAAA
jgi:predicted transcriptional regulator